MIPNNVKRDAVIKAALLWLKAKGGSKWSQELHAEYLHGMAQLWLKAAMADVPVVDGDGKAIMNEDGTAKVYKMSNIQIAEKFDSISRGYLLLEGCGLAGNASQFMQNMFPKDKDKAKAKAEDEGIDLSAMYVALKS